MHFAFTETLDRCGWLTFPIKYLLTLSHHLDLLIGCENLNWVPFAGSALVPIVYIPEQSFQEVTFSQEVISGIYSQEITSINDTRILSKNPGFKEVSFWGAFSWRCFRSSVPTQTSRLCLSSMRTAMPWTFWKVGWEVSALTVGVVDWGWDEDCNIAID